MSLGHLRTTVGNKAGDVSKGTGASLGEQQPGGNTLVTNDNVSLDPNPKPIRQTPSTPVATHLVSTNHPSKY